MVCKSENLAVLTILSANPNRLRAADGHKEEVRRPRRLHACWFRRGSLGSPHRYAATEPRGH
jgi:hypothetical protein